jgi:tRNA1Val (adenine37-N6)-methyltransferase
MKNRITILNKDARKLTLPDIRGPADLVVSNPPFKKQNSGRLNPCTQKAVAKHEMELTLKDVLRMSSNLLAAGGNIFLIFPSERTPEILVLMEKYRIQPDMIRFIHPRIPDLAKLVIVGGLKGGAGGLKVAPPLFIYNDQNEWTSEVKQMFSS